MSLSDGDSHGCDRGFVIPQWAKRYEPPAKVGAGGTKGLRYVMLRVFGHVLTVDYRKLHALAGDETMAAFGLFAKMLEMAGSEEKDRRDGTVYNADHEPASIEDIAFENMIPVPLATRWLGYLLDSDWLVTQVADVSRETAGNRGNFPPNPAVADVSRETAGISRRIPPNETETETKQNQTQQEQLNQELVITRADDSGSLQFERRHHSDSTSAEADTPYGGHHGVQQSCLLRLCEIFAVAPDPAGRDKSPRARQMRSDWTCLGIAIRAAVSAPDRDMARRQASEIYTLAREAAGSAGSGRPMARFVALAKNRYPGIFVRRAQEERPGMRPELAAVTHLAAGSSTAAG